jgi:hypothetical protein
MTLQRRSILGLILALATASAAAQEARAAMNATTLSERSVRPGAAEEFGAERTIWIVQSSGFQPYQSNVSVDYIGSGYRSLTGGGGGAVLAEASIQLPSGTLLERIELEACDESAGAQVQMNLLECGDSPSSNCNIAATVSTGGAATPGCDYFGVNLAIPIQVDNFEGNYYLSISDSNQLDTTRYRSARVYYRRQVSSGPLVATFPNDVPTNHPYFRFVEALADAGITAGCAPNTFCVNSPITRGEMAVFLAAALGLHFPL